MAGAWLDARVDPRVDAAVVLAGGAGRRLGGADKPVLAVGGAPMLHRVLAAADGAGATTRVVVGPDALPLPAGVRTTREDPPGGGPAAATAAGVALLPPDAAWVTLLAADLPLLSPAALCRLRQAVTAGYDGAVYTDDSGRAQWLCGVWRAPALRARTAGPATSLAGTALRTLLAPLRTATVADHGPHPPPWWDCDTENDRRRAEEWTHDAPEP